jgi:hypothetical protein
MRKVYQQTDKGWQLVYTAQSFSHACRVAKELTEQTGKQHCVNR